METTLDAKQVFAQCGTCSQTFAHILNREFDHPQEMAEVALDPLAGGILNTGHQCGMLWGAALATGAEAYRRYEDPDTATAVAIGATQHLLESFVRQTRTLNCRDITGHKLDSFWGLFRFMLSTIRKGMKNSLCFELAETWAPAAIESAQTGLREAPLTAKLPPLSCASEVVKSMGGTAEEAQMVAGFAGGLGLSGEGCGALAAVIWFKTLRWCQAHPGESPAFFRNKTARAILQAFREATKGETACRKICGRRFATVDAHTDYIRSGGCESILEVLAR